jgi:molybdopterin-containing oxidoreductase family membrane subunit
MPSEKQVIGLFKDENQAASAIESMAGCPWQLRGVNCPFPSERIMKAMKAGKSKVGYFTLAGGVIGFLSGIGLAAYTSLQWSLIVSGKPVVALIPYLIVGFEFTILFAVFGNIVGLITQTRLPEYRGVSTYDPRCSGEYFGVLASCAEGHQDALLAFFKEKGGEARFL